MNWKHHQVSIYLFKKIVEDIDDEQFLVED
jgi:hypothetical protein